MTIDSKRRNRKRCVFEKQSAGARARGWDQRALTEARVVKELPNHRSLVPTSGVLAVRPVPPVPLRESPNLSVHSGIRQDGTELPVGEQPLAVVRHQDVRCPRGSQQLGECRSDPATGAPRALLTIGGQKPRFPPQGDRTVEPAAGDELRYVVIAGIL